jgi:hypothetical protein
MSKEAEIEVSVDEDGRTIYGNSEVGWAKVDDAMAELDMKIERFVEDNVMKAFPDALLNENDQIYIRRIGGRLTWMKANVYGGGETWQELTPVTAKHLANGGVRPEGYKTTLTPEAVAELTKPETYKVGWYQDVKGDLYQYNGSEWVGTVPTKKQIAGLEYLG